MDATDSKNKRQEPADAAPQASAKRPGTLVIILRLLISIAVIAAALYLVHRLGIGQDSEEPPRQDAPRQKESPKTPTSANNDLALPPGATVISTTEAPDKKDGENMIILWAAGTPEEAANFFCQAHASAGWQRRTLPEERKKDDNSHLLMFTRADKERIIFIKRGASDAQVMIAVYNSRH